MTATTFIHRDRMLAWAIECLEAVGVTPDDAKTVAGALIQTSLWGVDSHGVARLFQ